MTSPTLDQLLTLATIVEEGSFAAAARTLHRVPSAISYTVKTLEDSLGLPLFDRSGHRAELTPEGRRLAEESAAVLAASRRVERVAEQLRAGWETDLRVVVDGAYPLEPLLGALKALAARGLPTRVQVEVEYQGGVAARFERGADLMLVLELAADADLHAEPLPPLEMRVLAAPSHPLAGQPRVQRTALTRHTEVVVKDSSPEYADTPRAPWFGSSHVVHLSDFHAKRMALLSGVGYGWMPDHLAAADVDWGRLVELDLAEGARWTYRPHLAWRRDRPLGRAGHLFVEFLRDELKISQTS
jgi:DNA-binding transcriptional LysR family regulator